LNSATKPCSFGPEFALSAPGTLDQHFLGIGAKRDHCLLDEGIERHGPRFLVAAEQIGPNPRWCYLLHLACLQTFPPSYRFFGSLESPARQIGNAVPPRMAAAIGLAIQNHCAQTS
jgi:hypothetical protein